MTFNIATTDGTATNSLPEDDYDATNITALTIPAGSTSVTFTVVVNGDLENESPSENFLVDISGLSANASLLDSQGLGTITDEDSASAPVVNNGGGASAIGVGEATLNMQMTAGTLADLTIFWGTSDEGCDTNAWGVFSFIRDGKQ